MTSIASCATARSRFQASPCAMAVSRSGLPTPGTANGSLASSRRRRKVRAGLPSPTRATVLRLATTDAAFAERLHESVQDSVAMIDQLLRDGGITLAGRQHRT